MKKVFLSFLILLLFTGYGMAQNSSKEEMETSKAVNTTPINLNSVKISDEERSHMETLKRTDVEAYKTYLRERSEIILLEKKIENQNGMDPAKKAEFTTRLKKLKAKHSF